MKRDLLISYPPVQRSERMDQTPSRVAGGVHDNGVAKIRKWTS